MARLNFCDSTTSTHRVHSSPYEGKCREELLEFLDEKNSEMEAAASIEEKLAISDEVIAIGEVLKKVI